jgi:carbon storage regulator
MLVLSRKRNEKIFLDTADGRIEVVVVDVKGDRVRLGIQAPLSVAIKRQEIDGLPPRKAEATSRWPADSATNSDEKQQPSDKT